MTQVKLTNLVSRLDPQSKRALENAAGDAMNQQCPTIEAEHWLYQLIAIQEPELLGFLESQKIIIDSLIQEINSTIKKLPKGGSGQPTLSGSLTELLKSAWLLASVDFGHQVINGLHILLALRQKNPLGVPFLSLNTLKEISNSALETAISVLKVASSNSGNLPTVAQGANVRTAALDKYTINLTELARQDKIDPVLGRNQEVRNVIDILCRKRQNNPILVGEPGVGKTAIVEGLARRIVNNDVPLAIQGVELRSLDLGLLQAGASVKGEFENRLKDIINEVKHSETPIIVFIDEAHTLIGAGGAEGQNDAANLLKPALARGEFRTIAATTWDEYKKYFEKDPALTRRFQVVRVEEPNAEDAVQMLRGVAVSLHEHHKVLIREDAVEAAVKMSIRYLPGRQLPDKAISLLDTSCARIALTQGATPQVIEQLDQEIQYLKNELEATERENQIFSSSAYDIESLQAKMDALEKKREELQVRCAKESELVTQVIDLQKKVVAALDALAIKNQREESEDMATENDEELAENHRLLNDKLAELEALQKGEPLIHAMVDKNTIAQVISDWTGIPSGNMLSDEVKRLLTIEEDLHERVIGQETAINEIAKSIRISRAGLTDERKPIGVFLMCGPSGVGKTETAMALTDRLYGGENDITVINMTEFKEEHKISMLLGAPAGYVGFGKGGVLTEAVRRNPYSVLLLDEMEKAHPGVQDLFYQIFDKGSIQDSEGRHIDFRNTIIIMTSNAADKAICDVCDTNDTRPELKDLVEQIRPALQQYYKPAFLGRTTVIPYYPLNQAELSKISDIALSRIRKRLEDNYKANFTYDPSFVEFVVSRNFDPTTGARGIEQIINRSLMPRLAAECLQLLSEGQTINRVHVSRATDTNDDFALSIS
jgi:type VI secretion system protein VasG